MTRNVSLYPWYIALFGMMAWLPIFFLFFSEHLTLEQVLQLEALYYFAVVLLEVPSGYFSDVVGRRPTLLVSAVAMSLAYTCFLVGASFPLFAAGQLLLATGFAFKSGTDTSFHYDSLAARQRTDEYGDREAIAGRNGLIASAIAVFLGGLVGLVSLRLAYGVSLLGALGALGIAFYFREPASSEQSANGKVGVLEQLRLSLGYMRQPVLMWLMAFAILMTILNHIPYEFYQPYLDLLGNDGGLLAGRTPLIAGIVMGLSTLLGSWAAARSIWIRNRIGIGRTLLLATSLQTLLIAVMGVMLHPLIVPFILLRAIPGSLAMAPLNAAIAPRVPQAQRATYLSIQSLAGRLAFSATLLTLSASTTAAANVDWPTLAWMLRAAAVFGVIGLIGLAVSRRALGGVAADQ